MKYISKLAFAVLISGASMAQNPAPGLPQTTKKAVKGATIYVGNGTIIENGTLVFENGIITEMGNNITLDTKTEVIDATGKRLYPSIISPYSQAGLNEIAAVRTTLDEREIGDFNPNVRALVAHNTDSEVIPTIRGNGLLIGQTTPVGGVISGRSSVFYYDGWNWEDAVLREDDGIWLNWPTTLTRQFDMTLMRVTAKKNEKYASTVTEIEKLFSDAKSYLSADAKKTVNLKLDAFQGVFDGKRSLYVVANEGKQIIEAVLFAKKMGVQKLVIVGAENVELAIPLLKENKIPVIVSGTHRIPDLIDENVWAAYTLPQKLMDEGILVGMYYNVSYWRTRNLPFVAGNCVAFGMKPEDALKMVTLNNAKILGIDDKVGTLEKGKHATFVISEGDILDMKTSRISNAFVKGSLVDLDDKQKRLHQKYSDKYKIK